MKQSKILKVVVAIAMMFMSSAVMADKLEIQDSTIIVVGKGQTNKKGVFTATEAISFDSISVDEIVLTYTNRKSNTLSITDLLTKKSVFSHDVKNSMTKGEMQNLCFSLLSGHTYIIQHGSKKWNIEIESPHCANNNLVPTDSAKVDSIGVKQQEGNDNENAGLSWLLWLLGGIENAGLSWLLWLLGGICVGAIGGICVCVCVIHKHQSDNKNEQATSKEGNDNIDEKVATDTNNVCEYKPNVDANPKQANKSEKPQQDVKDQGHKKTLQEIARLLELKDCQLQYQFFESKINEIRIKSKEEVAKELLKKFQESSGFEQLIEQARKKCNVNNPKENEILHNLVDEIAQKPRSLNNQINETVVKHDEPNIETGKNEVTESHIKWLSNHLRESFDFNYNENESVTFNIEQLINNNITKEVTSNSKVKESTANIEIAVNEALKNAKLEWEHNSRKEIDGLNSQINEKDETIQILNDQYKQEQESAVDALVEKLRRYTDMIEWLPMLDPCDNDEVTSNQCADIENRLDVKLKEMKERLSGFTSAKGVTPEQTFGAIQDALIFEITVDESIVNSLCRLYAYSQLPFMTDMKREYGVRIRRKNVNEIYQALENLYIQYGVKFQLPSLFVMESKDGDYENVTGQAYSELSNLCPNVNNHCDNIDTSMKLKDVIVDIDRIGYYVNGVIQSKARVLTF
ncbi:MAG: hypothetical protein MJ236_05980 [Clostridia bacterium]|nr:hypothetical protein [Clostridia bacterium]